MKPNKFEKQFKKQLDSREIKPSEMSWDKLDALLTVAEVRPRRNKNWIYLAASILGFLLISTVYFNNSSADITENKNSVVQEKKPSENTLITPEIINKSVFPKLNSNKIINVVSNNNNNLKKEQNQIKNKKEEVLIINQSKENNAIAISSENSNSQSTIKIKYISAEKLLAEVSNTKLEEKEIPITNVKSRKGIAINPNTLLLNAENELNDSFRETALDKFNKNFNAIKTVLVNRNFEE